MIPLEKDSSFKLPFNFLVALLHEIFYDNFDLAILGESNINYWQQLILEPLESLFNNISFTN